MENATKALEMAASVLIGMLIIGALVFTYTKISQTKQIEEDSLSSQQAADFNKKFEAYNKKGLYGSELLSLANLIVDYNEKIGSEDQGYKPVQLSVTMEKITGATVFTKTKYNSATDLSDCYDKLSRQISEMKDVKIKDKAISYWMNRSRRELEANLNPTEMKDIETYKGLVEEQEDMARKVFDVKDMKYDKNGRITSMTYTER